MCQLRPTLYSYYLFQVDEAIQGNLKEWESEPRPSLALIILTDQFTRNIYRVSMLVESFDCRLQKRWLSAFKLQALFQNVQVVLSNG